MAGGVIGFQGKRLLQAREARSLTSIALADLVDVSPGSISHYESGFQSPRPETLKKLSQNLNLPESFFLKPIFDRPEPKIFYRSMSSATKIARSRAERRYEWFREIVEYLNYYFDFPEINLPILDIPNDFRSITKKNIEQAANDLREIWNLGEGPILNLTRVLEANGIFVARGKIGAETLDAFSEIDHLNVPYIFLASDNDTLVRCRFSAAHELGHLILHKNLEKKSINKPSEFKLIENQAHHFAAAFLLPEKSFVDELYGVSLDAFRSLKPRWKISISAMIKRCEQLEMISEESAQRLWINRNRRGWREKEPLDDLPVEEPQLIAKSFKMLVENKVRTVEQIVDDLRLSANDIEELSYLEKGFLRPNISDETSPVLKHQKVVQFKRN